MFFFVLENCGSLLRSSIITFANNVYTDYRRGIIIIDNKKPTKVHCRMKASPNDLQTLLSCVARVRSLLPNFLISSLNRLVGLAHLLDPSIGIHSVTLGELVHY